MKERKTSGSAGQKQIIMASCLMLILVSCLTGLYIARKMEQQNMEAELAKLTAGMEVSQEDRLMLRMVLQVLSEEELQIVMLHAVAGCKHREIAQLLELPLPTVLSKYHRALKKLRKQWEEGNE